MDTIIWRAQLIGFVWCFYYICLDPFEARTRHTDNTANIINKLLCACLCMHFASGRFGLCAVRFTLPWTNVHLYHGFLMPRLPSITAYVWAHTFTLPYQSVVCTNFGHCVHNSRFQFLILADILYVSRPAECSYFPPSDYQYSGNTILLLKVSLISVTVHALVSIHGHRRHPTDLIYIDSAHAFIYRSVDLNVMWTWCLTGALWCFFPHTLTTSHKLRSAYVVNICVTEAFQI